MKTAFALLAIVTALSFAACRDGAAEQSPFVSPTPTWSEASPTPAPTVHSSATATPATPAKAPDTTDLLDQWEWYQDRETNLILRFPSGDFEEDTFDLPAKGKLPPVEVRSLRFIADSGVLAISLSIAPNPAELLLEEWITTYPGYPPDWSEIRIAGERGLVVPINSLGEPTPTIYFRHEQNVFTLAANFHGYAMWGAPAPMTVEQYEEMLRQLDFVVPALESQLIAFEDLECAYTLHYPEVWRLSQIALDETQLAFDILKGFELVGQGELLRASVYVFANPDNLLLEDWILDHNALFFDTEPEEAVIDGLPGLLQPLSLGIPSPVAYVAVGPTVISINGLTPDDYQVLADNIDLP